MRDRHRHMRKVAIATVNALLFGNAQRVYGTVSAINATGESHCRGQLRVQRAAVQSRVCLVCGATASLAQGHEANDVAGSELVAAGECD